MDRRDIALRPEGAARVHPDQTRVELLNGESVAYDYLVLAT
jgi:sulfide:quinone oxidoreductase